jgi:hypothetical protein
VPDFHHQNRYHFVLDKQSERFSEKVTDYLDFKTYLQMFAGELSDDAVTAKMQANARCRRILLQTGEVEKLAESHLSRRLHRQSLRG